MRPRQSVSLLKGDYGFFRAYHSCGAQKLFSLGARTTFDRGARRLVIANTYGVRINFRLPVIASAARRAAIRTPLSLRWALAPWQSVPPFKDITDSFALRTQNDTPFSYCKYNKACG